MALISAVVGYTTQVTSQVLAIHDRQDGFSRIAWRDAAGEHSLDRPITGAPPYGLVTFPLAALAGPKVTYGIGDAATQATLPSEAALLAGDTKTFRTVADGPRRLGLVSCNDIHARRLQAAERGAMWRRLRRLVDEEEVDLLLHLGDQVYADGIPKGLLPGEDKAAAYRRHYVNTWSHPDVAGVLGRCPSLMMWDDHEIYDGWGSNDNDVTEAALQRFRAAELAFRSFQDPLNPPDRLAGGLGWLAKYGQLAILAVDGRSHRNWASGAILGKQQLDALQLRLGELSALQLKHLMVIVGTPVVYVPLMAAEGAASLVSRSSLDDIRDGWTASKNREECRRFLMNLFHFAGQSPGTQVTIVAGDIHVGTVAQIDTEIGFGPQRLKPRLYQVTSSGIARPAPRGLEALALGLISSGGTQELFNQDIRGKLRQISASDHDYCIAHRNFAVLDPSDGKGNFDTHQNLWIRFHVEQRGNPVLEHQLVRKLA